MSRGVSIRRLSASARKNSTWKQNGTASYWYILTNSAKTKGSPVTLKSFSLYSVYFEYFVFCHKVRSMMTR